MIVPIHNTCADFNTYRAARVKSLFNPERGNEFIASFEPSCNVADLYRPDLLMLPAPVTA